MNGVIWHLGTGQLDVGGEKENGKKSGQQYRTKRHFGEKSLFCQQIYFHVEKRIRGGDLKKKKIFVH